MNCLTGKRIFIAGALIWIGSFLTVLAPEGYATMAWNVGGGAAWLGVGAAGIGIARWTRQ